jgi:alpha-amylase
VLGLDGVKQIFNAFESYNGSDKLGDISGLSVFGRGSGLTMSSKTVSFVTNHDTNHDPANALTYMQGRQYRLANEWLLADGYGSPQLFSSFTFGDDTNQSPPAAENGVIDNTSCSNGKWTCDHRRHAIVSMVRFHKYVQGSAKQHVYDDEFNVLAFSRGSKGWAGFNNNATPDHANNSGVRTITVQTGMRKGTYCDIISGGKSVGDCTGRTVRVRANGTATIRISARGAVAFTEKDRL